MKSVFSCGQTGNAYNCFLVAADGDLSEMLEEFGFVGGQGGGAGSAMVAGFGEKKYMIGTATLQLTNGAAPALANFGVNSVSVIDAVLYSTISGMGASVAGVTLQ